MKQRWIMALFAGLGLTSGCGFGIEGGFVGGRELDLCADTIPACFGSAGCRLGGQAYVETSFPGNLSFIVPAPEDATIVVSIFFRSTLATGVDHRVIFYEPGCFDQYTWIPDTEDLFREAGNDLVLEVEQQIALDGEHLVEVFSDSTAEVLIKADVETGGGRL